MKKVLLQMVFMSACVFSAFMLNVLMFAFCIEHQGDLNPAHAILGSMFCLVAIMCTRILCNLAQEYRELKDEYEQRLLDADDYASREY